MKKSVWSKIWISLLIGAPLLYTLLGFFVAPIIAKNVLQSKVAQTLQHDITVDKIKINPLEFTIDASNLAINDPKHGPVLSLRRLFVDFEISSLFLDTLVLADVILEQPWINVVLAKDGEVNLARLAPPTKSTDADQPNEPSKPVLIESIIIKEASVLFEDLSAAQPIQHIFEPINIQLEQVSTQVNAMGLSEIQILTKDKEHALIKSQFSFDPLRLRSLIDIADFNLERLNVHLTEDIPVQIQNGRLGLNGRLVIDQKQQGPLYAYFQGGLKISEVALNDRNRQPVLGFKLLEIPAMDLSLIDSVVAIERIGLHDLQLQTGLNERGEPRLLSQRIRRQPDPENDAPSPVDNLKFYLGEFKLDGGQIVLDDSSVTPPVHMELSDLKMRVTNISNLENDIAAFQLETTLNNTASVRLEGHSRPFSDTVDANLKLDLDDYDLIKVSPYAGKYIGYEIDRGSLGIDASYQIKGTSLSAKHDILLSNLTLGANVESPDALKAPVKLGLSLLEDSQRRIKLNLPVEGDLANPEFSLGSVIRKSFVGVITKMVSSPFSILGSIAGVKGEELDYVGFAPGASILTEIEQKKLINISQAMKVRPRLMLTIHPAVAKKADLRAMKTQLFDQEVAQLTKGKRHGHDPKVLKKIYKKRIGSKEYAQKLKAFREKSADLDNPQTRFIEEIRQDLIERQAINDDALDKLSDLRGQSVQNFLLEKSAIDATRLTIGKRQSGKLTETGIIKNKFSVSSK